MAYNGWKMMGKVDVAIKTSPSDIYYNRIYTGYVVEHGDKKALETAKSWAFDREYDREKGEYTTSYEPDVHTFDNSGFTVRILEPAGGSSQGGRLSFMACEIEKDGIKFVIGVNDALLVDLIRHSTIINGEIQERVMFVRKGGQPGFIHEKMEAYQEAQADMKKKRDLKSAKKTKKWEIGGVYSTLNYTSVCTGEVWDTLEEVVTHADGWPSYSRPSSKYVKRDTPVKTYSWITIFRRKDLPETFTELLTDELSLDRNLIEAGTPPARAKSKQYVVKESDLKLIDSLLTRKREYHTYYSEKEVFGRYVRMVK